LKFYAPLGNGSMALGPEHRLSMPDPPGRRKLDGTLLRSRFRTIQVCPKDFFPLSVVG
jgi:hypothetical protein